MEISESNLTFDLSETTTMEAERNTHVQEKVRRNEGKEIKAEMNSGVAVGWAILLCYGCDLTCGWDLFSDHNYNIDAKLMFH